MKTLYTAAATSTGGRQGTVVSSDDKLHFSLTVPKEMGGPGGDGTNPEQLFACGYSACFAGALGLVARLRKVNPGPFTITAHVSIGQDDGGGYGLAVTLEGAFADIPKDQATELMHAAHEVCPYSKATRGNIDVTLSVGG
jgi:Ohr subfamily peroxiredoxin